ncbi:EmrB/QacA subfamily drug resistance transporter [Desulfohalotomaculum tongense]|uniref:MFS transporter n=1 Tax=Desulforadius tongensis TaxID=1216062 RepID=UPI001959AF4F|nr:MFS transporter [Desulforadius tongensis]MBM7856184.1 EmrB/QacA subfamily drug resistance transporter [Desulforadius tongensis]
MNGSVTKVSNKPDDKYKWKALTAIAIGTFMAPLDGSIVNITLPYISSAFGTDMATVEWVVMSYLLIISSLLLTYGRLGDMLGYKTVYITGFVIFTLGSVLCAMSPSIRALIGFRVVQALGAGMMMAIGPALVTSIFPPQERGKALGIIGSTVASALAFGPVLGGLLVDFFGWRSVFLINLPIGVYAVYRAAAVLKPTGRDKNQRFDIPGAITLFSALMTFLLAASHGQQWGWGSPVIIGLLSSSILLLALFIWIELRVPSPMMDLSLFKIRLFTTANISLLISFLSHFSIVFLFPFYLKEVRSVEPSITGILMAASPMVILFAAPLSGALSDRIGSRLLSSLGLGIVAVAMLLMSSVGINTSFGQISLYLALLGLGIGLFQSPNNSAIMGSVPRHRLGIASGTLASMRNIGMVMGTATAGAIFTTRLPIHYSHFKASGCSTGSLYSLAFVTAMHDVFFTGAVLALIGMFISMLREKNSAESTNHTL